MYKALIFLVSIYAFVSQDLQGQNFYIEKAPKKDYYKMGVGIGKFFTSPRELLNEIENNFGPFVSVGIGRKFSSHLSLNANASFQRFSSNGLLINERSGEITRNRIFSGFALAFDVMPEFNLIPYYHHLDRPKVDLQVGLGLGFLQSGRLETILLSNEEFKVQTYNASPYIPLRTTVVFNTGLLSSLSVEGSFFYTFINEDSEFPDSKVDNDHLAQIVIVYKCYFKNKTLGY